MKTSRILGAALLTLLYAGPILAQADPEQPGSFLVYPKFDIRSGSCTQLRITNINDEVYIGVTLNYVCPGVLLGDQRCKATNRHLVLTPHETRIIDVAEHKPQCKRGFVVAYAVQYDLQTNISGGPVAFDYLIGSWHITRSRMIDSENAIAIQSNRSEGTLLGTGNPLELSFGPTGDYAGLGSELYTDFRAVNHATGDGTKLTLLSLDTLAGRQNPATSIYLDHWNAVEVPFSGSHEWVCWDESDLADIDVNFMVDALGTDYGSMTIGALPNCPMPGGCPPLQYYQPVLLGTINEYTTGGTSARNLFSDDSQESTVYVPR